MAKELRNYCVYMHINKVNGKKYIGITKLKPEYRWSNGNGYKENKHFYSSIKKYGWENFEHKIVYANLTKNEACEKEIELIDFYETTDFNKGYNISFGGEGGLSGVYNLESMSVKVYQYDMDGNFINEYPSMMEAERQTGVENSAICGCCKGKTAYAKDYIWSYEYHDKINPIDKLEHIINTVRKEQYKPVHRYSIDGIYIDSFESLSIASKELNISFKLISKCCLGERYKTHGFIFSYIMTNDFEELKNRKIYNTNKGKHVLQYQDNKLINKFISIMDASRQTGISDNKISRCCNGRVKSADGYVFKFD